MELVLSTTITDHSTDETATACRRAAQISASTEKVATHPEIEPHHLEVAGGRTNRPPSD